MTVDRDGKIRMDCSSPYAMARLVGLKDRYDVAFANDTTAFLKAPIYRIVAMVRGELKPAHFDASMDSLRAIVQRHLEQWPLLSAFL